MRVLILGDTREDSVMTLVRRFREDGVKVFTSEGYDVTEETALEHLFCGNTPHLVINMHTEGTIEYRKADLSARIFSKRWGATYTCV